MLKPALLSDSNIFVSNSFSDHPWVSFESTNLYNGDIQLFSAFVSNFH